MKCILPVTINVRTDRLSPIAKIDLISKESRSFLGQVGHYIVQKQGAANKFKKKQISCVAINIDCFFFVINYSLNYSKALRSIIFWDQLQTRVAQTHTKSF